MQNLDHYEKYGKLIVLNEDIQGVSFCKCDCGKYHFARTDDIKRGKIKSCGCYRVQVTGDRRRTHGMSGKNTTRAYSTWRGMHQRCEDKNADMFKYYGGRGILVCKEWSGRDGFVTFLSDMGNPPENMSLDRIDNSKGYSKENCRWATATQQARNKREVVKYRIGGKTIAQISEETGTPISTIYWRIYKQKL